MPFLKTAVHGNHLWPFDDERDSQYQIDKLNPTVTNMSPSDTKEARETFTYFWDKESLFSQHQSSNFIKKWAEI